MKQELSLEELERRRAEVDALVSADPFYSEPNQARIRAAIQRLDAGLGTEHELIDADE